MSEAAAWRLRNRVLDLSAPRVMGILNVTPDSFSDGGQHAGPAAALARARRIEAEGADIIDLGAESTRPGSRPVGEAEETRRLMPVLEALSGRLRIPISVDTSRSAVARRALEAGAEAINDVSAGRDPGMFALAAETGAGLVLMHMKGTPENMQDNPVYGDLLAEVGAFLAARIRAARAAGVDPGRVVVDPGIGFGKTAEGNLLLLKHAGRFRESGRPVMVGASRKGFIGLVTGAPVTGRQAGSAAAAVCAFLAGAAIFRVHDVRATRQALAVARAVSEA